MIINTRYPINFMTKLFVERLPEIFSGWSRWLEFVNEHEIVQFEYLNLELL